MQKIGLTGGIGSGKSTVASILVKHEVWLIDADEISRSTTRAGGVAIPAIRSSFGHQAISFDGSLDRDAMRQIIVSDQSAKSRLEGILHPLIGELINQQLELAEKNEAEIVILDIPLLVEAGFRWRSRLDAIWVVDCMQHSQISRVQARSGWPKAQIEAVMASQATRSGRRAAADAIIFNNDLTMEALEKQVLDLLNFAKHKVVAKACTMIADNNTTV